MRLPLVVRRNARRVRLECRSTQSISLRPLRHGRYALLCETHQSRRECVSFYSQPDPLLHQDARQLQYAGNVIKRSAISWKEQGLYGLGIKRRPRPSARIEPEAAGVQYGAANRASRPDFERNACRPMATSSNRPSARIYQRHSAAIANFLLARWQSRGNRGTDCDIHRGQDRHGPQDSRRPATASVEAFRGQRWHLL